MKTEHTIVWHYTTGDAFLGILRDGHIRASTGGQTPNEKPITWFSTEPLWEPTVYKKLMRPDGTGEQLGMSGLLAHGFQLIRIGAPAGVAPLRWTDIKEQSGIPVHEQRWMARVSKDLGGNPSRWRGAWGAVQIVGQLAVIERFDTALNAWVALPTEEAA